MVDTSQLIFHIVYTPGTVRYLLPFVKTLLHWSDCRFCLVANGCSAAEQTLLQAFCSGQPRLTYRCLTKPTRQKHGEVLNELQRHNQSPYFCFMDSDILACGDFMAAFADSLGCAAAIFSGIPLHCTAEDLYSRAAWPIVWGEQVLSEEALIPGGSFFAIYDQQILTQLMRTTKVDFRVVHWPNLPLPVRQKLVVSGFKKVAYDTGKVLNWLLQTSGHKVVLQPTEHLQHIGGVSLWATPVFYKNVLPSPTIPLWTRVQRRIRRLVGLPKVNQDAFQQLPSLHPVGIARKQAVSRYFGELLYALVEQKPLPPLLQGQASSVDQRIAEVTQTLITLWERDQVTSDLGEIISATRSNNGGAGMG